MAANIKFWGARGSVPTPDARNQGYGGNTSCIELTTGSRECIIFDAGTGIANLGRQLAETRPDLTRVHIFLTHFHWDHIQGLPYFPPLFKAGTEIRFYASAPAPVTRSNLAGQMAFPYFPVDLDGVAARLEFVEMSTSPVHVGDTVVSAFPLHHPQGATGYRVEFGGRVLVYATDHEDGDPALDAVLRTYAEGARILIIDAQYTPEEQSVYKGWGHGSWLAASNLARAARIGQLVLFHHDPHRDDEAIARIEEQARQHFAGAMAAREGSSVEL